MEKEIKLTPFYFDNVLCKRDNYDIIIQLGGRFSAKTMNEQRRAIGTVGSAEDYKLLVIENLETGMADGFYSGLRQAIRDFEHEPAYNPQSRTAYIKNEINGNEVLFRGYATEQQKYNVKRLNSITECIVEEGEWVSYDDMIALYQQLRGGSERDRKLTILLNPIEPDCFINTEFIMKPPEHVLEYFPNSNRPKVFEQSIRAEIEGEAIIIKILVVISTYRDNPYLTPEQILSILNYKNTDMDKYEQLANAKFIHPKGALLTRRNYYSLERLDLDQSARITAIVDTASSGTDSATLGIYAKYDDEHHYLIDAIRDPDDAKKVIPRMISMINKYKPQTVKVEKNHEGLYYESEIKKGVYKSILVKKFHSSENKHEKILGQSGRMIEHLYIRDDGGEEYNSFIAEMYRYNKDKKKNKEDDCIDNAAMYFKHGDKGPGVSFLQ